MIIIDENGKHATIRTLESNQLINGVIFGLIGLSGCGRFGSKHLLIIVAKLLWQILAQ